MKTPLVFVLLAAILLLAIPSTLLAVDTYLPSINTQGVLPEHLNLPPSGPTPSPTPEIRLQDGRYEYDDGRVRVYFKVINNGSTIDYAGFSIESLDPYKIHCGDAGGGYPDGTHIENGRFSLANDFLPPRVPISYMNCTVDSDTAATCQVLDRGARRSGLAPSTCGSAKVTVTLQNR